MQLILIITSIKILRKNTGIVIFGGSAARSVINDIAIAAITKAQRSGLADEIAEEHKELRSSFESIKNADDLTVHLDKLGNALERHIRKEERVFFPLIQDLCSDKLLSEIEQALSVQINPQ